MSASPPPASDDSETSLVKVADNNDEKSSAAPKQNALDNFLRNYVKFTSSALNTDRSLKLLQWTLWLASYMKKSQGLKKLSLDLSFARYALRLLGLPASMEAARNGSWGNKTHPWLGQIMAWSMIGYYPMEHVAYVRWQAPQLLPNQSAERWSAWSCRCWLLYIVADMTQSTLKLKGLLKDKREILEKEAANEEGKQENDALILVNDLIRNEQLQIVRSLLFTLPAIHWSLPKWDTHPWLKESVVNGLMWAEAVVSMYQSLRSFQA
jgi:hypothetical protein